MMIFLFVFDMWFLFYVGSVVGVLVLKLVVLIVLVVVWLIIRYLSSELFVSWFVLCSFVYEVLLIVYRLVRLVCLVRLVMILLYV